ncbi:MAG: tetratricopeptide repeat protein [Betaproteobacteria bacterium]
MPSLPFGFAAHPEIYACRAVMAASRRSALLRHCARLFAGPLLAATVLTVQAQPVFPEPATRAQALAALEHSDPRQRAAAVLFVARTGLPPDGPLLVKRLADEDPLVRELAEAGAWQVWSRSGDAATDRLFATGAQQMSAGDLQAAIGTFTQVIRRSPAFAEGWNKRATAYFLAAELQKSLADCDEVIKRNPQHFGALSGYGQIYVQLGDYDRALAYFRRALAVNPNMAGAAANIRAIEELLREKRRKMI